MVDMDNGRISKAAKLRAVARQLRAKAGETQLAFYIDLMQRSAAELELLADQIEAEDENGEACLLYA